jgi:hypothetical protein
MLDEYFCDRIMMVKRGVIPGVFTLVVRGVHVGALFEEELDDLFVAMARGEDEGGLAGGVGDIYRDSFTLEQDPNLIKPTVDGGFKTSLFGRDFLFNRRPVHT